MAHRGPRSRAEGGRTDRARAARQDCRNCKRWCRAKRRRWPRPNGDGRGGPLDDALSALVNLGYKRLEAKRAIDAVAGDLDLKDVTSARQSAVRWRCFMAKGRKPGAPDAEVNTAPSDDGRLAAAPAVADDQEIGLSLRPRSLGEFVGQERLKKILEYVDRGCAKAMVSGTLALTHGRAFAQSKNGGPRPSGTVAVLRPFTYDRLSLGDLRLRAGDKGDHLAALGLADFELIERGHHVAGEGRIVGLGDSHPRVRGLHVPSRKQKEPFQLAGEQPFQSLNVSDRNLGISQTKLGQGL